MNIKDIKNLEHMEAFYGNFAVYKITDGKEGIINREGEIILEAKEYDMVFREMKNSIYSVSKDDERVKYFDAEKQQFVELSPLDIYRAKQWPENIVCIKKASGKGAINLTTGETVIPYEYDLVSYKKSFHVILVKDKAGKYGLFDEDGKVILPVEFDYMSISLDRGFDEIAVTKDGRNYFINAKQEEVKVF